MTAAFVKGRPYGGWAKSLVDMATFDSYPEFQVAVSLDRSTDLEWWLRNDSPLFGIQTPIGGFEPDFLYGCTDGRRGILEVKGGFLWQGPESREQIKANSACEWVEAQNSMDGASFTWEFAVIIDDDIEGASHLDALRHAAARCAP